MPLAVVPKSPEGDELAEKGADAWTSASLNMQAHEVLHRS